jgi:hypothetical protein
VVNNAATDIDVNTLIHLDLGLVHPVALVYNEK